MINLNLEEKDDSPPSPPTQPTQQQPSVSMSTVVNPVNSVSTSTLPPSSSSTSKIVPKCVNNHQLHRNSNGVQYMCNACCRHFNNRSHPSMRCAQCDYDLCPTCASSASNPNPNNSSVKLRCTNNHPLAQYPSIYANNQYICNCCRKAFSNKNTRAYHCKSCGYDLCPGCANKKM